MSKRDEFKAFMEINKRAVPNITDEIYKGYLNLAKTDYGLTTQEVEKILKEVGITVGSSVNYFKELKLNIDEIKNLSDTEAERCILDAYEERVEKVRDTIASNNPRRAELLNLLAKARVYLIEEGKWKQHLQKILGEGPIIKFRNGDEATSIPQLATLMEKNAREATDILYQGDLEKGLAEAGETAFVQAAKAVTHQFSSDRPTGLLAMVAILSGKVKMNRGDEAGTPSELARLIDQNWEQAKILLYNGFFALWLEYTGHTQLANAAEVSTTHNRSKQDISLEILVQQLDPRIGKPKLRASPSSIDFGRMGAADQKVLDLNITNVGRGFLYGDARIKSKMPGLRISNTEIHEGGVITVKLDANALTTEQAYQTSLAINTNGGNLKVPISCYIDYPVQQSVPEVPKIEKKSQTRKSVPEVPKIEKKFQIRNTGRSIGWWLVTGLLAILFSAIGGFIGMLGAAIVGLVIIFPLALFKIFDFTEGTENFLLFFFLIAGMVIGFIHAILSRLGGSD